MSLLAGRGAVPGADSCSRAGCAVSANWQLRWRNPRIHAEDRQKIWLACDEHRDYLTEFLRAREFPVAVVPFTGAAR
ncbi:MAG: hypothetical protein ACSLE3_01070 [Microbacteriaceae bacterium]